MNKDRFVKILTDIEKYLQDLRDMKINSLNDLKNNMEKYYAAIKKINDVRIVINSLKKSIRS